MSRCAISLGDNHNVAASGSGHFPQGKEFLDFLEREAQLLGTLDEKHQIDGLRRVLPVARGPLRRLGNQPLPLIKAEGFDVYARQAGELAGVKRSHRSSLIEL